MESGLPDQGMELVSARAEPHLSLLPRAHGGVGVPHRALEVRVSQEHVPGVVGRLEQAGADGDVGELVDGHLDRVIRGAGQDRRQSGTHITL